MQGIEHWIEASMADLARGLGGADPGDARGDRQGALDLEGVLESALDGECALDGERALGAAWLTEDAWPVEPVWAAAPAWHTEVEDGLVVTSTDDVVQLDRSSRLTALRLDIS